MLGVGDTTVAAYNDELRRITQLLNLTHITFVRVADLLEPGAELRPPMTAEEYIATAPGIRAKFLATEPEYSDVKQLIASDVGAERTRPVRPAHVPCLIDSETGKTVYLEDVRVVSVLRCETANQTAFYLASGSQSCASSVSESTI